MKRIRGWFEFNVIGRELFEEMVRVFEEFKIFFRVFFGWYGVFLIEILMDVFRLVMIISMFFLEKV